MVETERKR